MFVLCWMFVLFHKTVPKSHDTCHIMNVIFIIHSATHKEKNIYKMLSSLHLQII